MERRSIKAILLVVVILSPLFTFAYLDTALLTTVLSDFPSLDVVFLTLKDLWYPVAQETHVYPMFIIGEAGGYYRRPILTLPSSVHIDVFAIDATNNTVNLTWIDVQSLYQLWSGKSVNVSYNPGVNGTYGEGGVTYQEGIGRSETWNAQGNPDYVTGSVFESGLPRRDNQSHSHLCSIELAFGLSPQHHGVVWTLLLGLLINRTNALTIACHEINFMISYTYYWTDYLLGGLQTDSDRILDPHQTPENLTLGNGESYGQWDCGIIYVLEGDVEFTILGS